MVASTRRRVFSARSFSSALPFFPGRRVSLAVTILRERGLEKRVPERNDATVDRASDAQKRVVRYRFVSIPAVLALFRRVRRRAPLPRHNAREARPTIAVSMSRIVAQKTREQERKKTTRTARPSLLSLDANESNERTRNDAIGAGFVEDGGVDVSVRVVRANRICRIFLFFDFERSRRVALLFFFEVNPKP